ncbi:hypothetical protein HDV00_006728 [Rhizophlyctis rosea]|nr:hypothetical protein HDV00_006728 [Rhizophlyctis rosea]
MAQNVAPVQDEAGDVNDKEASDNIVSDPGRVELYFSGHHWIFIFDYLNISELIKICQTATVFQQQLLPFRTTDTDAASAAPSSHPTTSSALHQPMLSGATSRYRHSSYFTQRLLYALLKPYQPADYSIPSLENTLSQCACMPTTIQQIVTYGATNTVIPVFKVVRKLMRMLYHKACNLRCSEDCPHHEHVPIPAFSLDGPREEAYRQVDAERVIRYLVACRDYDWLRQDPSIGRFLDELADQERLKGEEACRRKRWTAIWPMPRQHREDEEQQGGPADISQQHMVLPLDAMFILRYFAQFLLDILRLTSDDYDFFHSYPICGEVLENLWLDQANARRCLSIRIG